MLCLYRMYAALSSVCTPAAYSSDTQNRKNAKNAESRLAPSLFPGLQVLIWKASGLVLEVRWQNTEQKQERRPKKPAGGREEKGFKRLLYGLGAAGGADDPRRHSKHEQATPAAFAEMPSSQAASIA